MEDYEFRDRLKDLEAKIDRVHQSILDQHSVLWVLLGVLIVLSLLNIFI